MVSHFHSNVYPRAYLQSLDVSFHTTASSPSPYSWDSQDSKMIESVDFILAADGNDQSNQ